MSLGITAITTLPFLSQLSQAIIIEGGSPPIAVTTVTTVTEKRELKEK